MAENTNPSAEPQDVPGVATLLIPENLAQQVVDYLDTLETGGEDVSGYMLNLGFAGTTFRATTTTTTTNCKTTTVSPHGDYLCDTDQWIEP